MGSYALATNDSKMLFACLSHSLVILNKIYAIRDVGLKELFPSIDSQWDDIISILELGISRKIAWAGMSFTKSDGVPDDTRIPMGWEINADMAQLMMNKAHQLGVTLNYEYNFITEEQVDTITPNLKNYVNGSGDDDATEDFSYIVGIWGTAVQLYIEILTLFQELMLLKVSAGGHEYSLNNIDKSPAQLIMFDTLEASILNTPRRCNYWNTAAIASAFGSYYSSFLHKPIMDTFNLASIPEITNGYFESVTSGTKSDVGGFANYAFTYGGTHDLIGAYSIFTGSTFFLDPTYTGVNTYTIQTDLVFATAPSTISSTVFSIDIA